MSRSPRGIWTLAGLAAALPLAWLVPVHHTARSEARARLDQLAEATDAAARITALERTLPEWARATGRGVHATGAPRAGLAQQVAGLLAAVNLPPATLANLNATGDDGTAAGSALLGGAGGGGGGGGPAGSDQPRVVRRRAALTLTGLTLPQLGAFIADWRERLPEWTLTSIEITPIDAAAQAAVGGGATGSAGGGGGAGGGGSDLPLRVQITTETLALTGSLSLARSAPPRTGTGTAAGAASTSTTAPAQSLARPRGSDAGSPLLPGPSPRRSAANRTAASPPPPPPSATGDRP